MPQALKQPFLETSSCIQQFERVQCQYRHSIDNHTLWILLGRTTLTYVSSHYPRSSYTFFQPCLNNVCNKTMACLYLFITISAEIQVISNSFKTCSLNCSFWYADNVGECVPKQKDNGTLTESFGTYIEMWGNDPRSRAEANLSQEGTCILTFINALLSDSDSYSYKPASQVWLQGLTLFLN